MLMGEAPKTVRIREFEPMADTRNGEMGKTEPERNLNNIGQERRTRQDLSAQALGSNPCGAVHTADGESRGHHGNGDVQASQRLHHRSTESRIKET